MGLCTRPGKTREGSKLPLLTGLETLHVQEVKAKAELSTVRLSVEGMPQHSYGALWKGLGGLQITQPDMRPEGRRQPCSPCLGLPSRSAAQGPLVNKQSCFLRPLFSGCVGRSSPYAEESSFPLRTIRRPTMTMGCFSAEFLGTEKALPLK